jgi:hypothetical protein
MNREKRLNQVARARRLTPQERLEASVNLSRAVDEFHRAGKKYREGDVRNSRS